LIHGAQKNLDRPASRSSSSRRPAGAHAVTLPTMLQYGVHVENKSLYNTPPVFGIYIMRLVLQWLIKAGGLRRSRGQRTYAQAHVEIDRSGFYRALAAADSRSRCS
jgi:phosphoserine aminotransferase